MTDTRINLDIREHVAIVTLDRPSRHNAFNDRMIDELHRVTSEIEKLRPRATVITGAGDTAFSAGFDVNPDNPLVTDFIKAAENHDTAPAARSMGRIRQVVDNFISLPMPTIAALNGLAYGGGAEFAVRCDLRVMDPNALICFSEVRLGLMPDWGGGATLARLIGPSRAADVILTARKIQAAEALSLGIINRISDVGKSLETAVDLANQIAQNGPKAVRNALKIIRGSMNIPHSKLLDYELAEAVELIASGECLHGVSAFLLKKPPVFPEINDTEN